MPLPDGQGFFLAGQDTQLRLTRFIPNSDSWTNVEDNRDDDRLRILVVVSNPRIPGMTELDGGEIVDVLLGLDASRFHTNQVTRPTRAQLRDEIERLEPHVIHYIGHGRPNELALQKDAATIDEEQEDYEDRIQRGERPPPPSEAEWVDAFTACGLLPAGLDRNAPARLVFLHACEGATPDITRASLEGFAGLARQLASGPGVNGVVAMQYTISVSDAEVFAQAFYRYVCDGLPIDEAVTAARKDFAETPISGRQSWDDRSFGTPVTYLRRDDPIVVRHRRAQPDDGSAGQPVKEACPNPDCTGLVIRTANPPTCRKCSYPFIPCPHPTCSGLVVPKAGFGCTIDDYVYGAEERSDVSSTSSPVATPQAPDAGVEPSAFEGSPLPAGVGTLNDTAPRVPTNTSTHPESSPLPSSPFELGDPGDRDRHSDETS